MKKIAVLITLACLCLVIIQCQQKRALIEYPDKIVEVTPQEAQTAAEEITNEVNVEVHDDFELSLWASDKLVQDPIAISIDTEGRIYYTKATRQENSEFDIRGHRNWMTASISFETVEDRRKFLKETFEKKNEEGERFLKDLNKDGTLDWRDLAVQKEEVWIVNGNEKYATSSKLYLQDFNQEITDVANGIEHDDGKVYIAVGPDLWKTEDTNNDDKADQVKSLSHGYAVHIGFSGHGMSGIKRGPDGRLWWGIGDIGANVVDQTGKRWKYPNQGVIVRSEVDGSGFEVFCSGVRNTHEFDFDKYGNLITEDNDGDHAGERERLVYLINGSETGWRINWQFGKYTDPLNNDYKVWMDEKMHVPRWDGQAAYFLPPIRNYVNGPTGFAYNPGTALGPKWYDHFFIAEFRGTPANSPLHAFTMKPDGAGFDLDTTMIVTKGLLPTGIDFGPDGALYFADWIDGWGIKEGGRIWKLDIPGEDNSAIRKETQQLIKTDFSALENNQLATYLGHQDRRIRQKAQFELADRKEYGYNTLLETATTSSTQLARIHALWGIGQLARLENKDYADAFVKLLDDSDVEIVTQAVRMIGDVYYDKGAAAILPLLKREEPRLVMMTTQSLGRLEYEPAIEEILEVVEKNNDKDLWIRHAAMVALGRIGKTEPLAALSNHPSKAVRTVAVVSLRRIKSPEVAKFLSDKDEYIIAEAARAINDDYSIPDALPALAELLDNHSLTNEAAIRRAIGANLRVGNPENLERLINYASAANTPEEMRAEAIEAASTWSSPSVFDRVDGRYRGVVTRSADQINGIAASAVDKLINDSARKVQIAAIHMVDRLQIKSKIPSLRDLLSNSVSSAVRKEALSALNNLNAEGLSEDLALALKDKSSQVRSKALELLPESSVAPDEAATLLSRVLDIGSVREKQAALTSLGTINSPTAITAIAGQLEKLISGSVEDDIKLELVEAAENQKDESLQALLTTYQNTKDQSDPLAPYLETLAGGDAGAGRGIFYGNEAAQCVRCHAIFEYGGNAGPGLMGVGSRLSKKEILESMVYPSATYAKGYEVISVENSAGENTTGILVDESPTSLTIKVGAEDVVEIAVADIAKRESIPSSMFPMKDILTKKELRDLVAFLSNLKGPAAES